MAMILGGTCAEQYLHVAIVLAGHLKLARRNESYVSTPKQCQTRTEPKPFYSPLAATHELARPKKSMMLRRWTEICRNHDQSALHSYAASKPPLQYCQPWTEAHRNHKPVCVLFCVFGNREPSNRKEEKAEAAMSVTVGSERQPQF